MAFTRKWLAALGIDADKIDEIMTAHTEVTEALKTQIAENKTDKASFDEVKTELENTKKKLADLEKEDYKTKYESEKKAHDELKTDIANKESKAKKSSAFKAMLKEKGYSDNAVNKIAKYGGYVDNIEFDNDGKLKDVDKLIANIESEWGEYKPTVHNDVHEPPTPHKTDNKPVDEMAQRMKAFNEKYNEQNFGIKPESKAQKE